LKPREIGEADLDQRPDRVLEPGLACHRKGLLVALPYLLRVDALFETVVPGYQEPLDLRMRVFGLHAEKLAAQSSALGRG